MSTWVILQSSTLAFTLKCLEEVWGKLVESSKPAQPFIFISSVFFGTTLKYHFVPHADGTFFLVRLLLLLLLLLQHFHSMKNGSVGVFLCL